MQVSFSIAIKWHAEKMLWVEDTHYWENTFTCIFYNSWRQKDIGEQFFTQDPVHLLLLK